MFHTYSYEEIIKEVIEEIDNYSIQSIKITVLKNYKK